MTYVVNIIICRILYKIRVEQYMVYIETLHDIKYIKLIIMFDKLNVHNDVTKMLQNVTKCYVCLINLVRKIRLLTKYNEMSCNIIFCSIIFVTGGH